MSIKLTRRTVVGGLASAAAFPAFAQNLKLPTSPVTLNFVDVAGKPMRLQIQAVGSRIDHYFDRAWMPDEERATRLVVIGLHEMDETAVRRAIEALA